jgi:tetratricopeptide (TPR) repeat protein
MSGALEFLAQGLTAHRAGALAPAEAYYRATLALQPDQAQAVYLLGVLLLGDNRAAEAVPVLRRAVALRGNEAEVLANYAHALMETGACEEAVAASRAALQRDLSLSQAHATLGRALLGLGEVAPAEAAFRAVISCAPGSAAAHAGLAMALLHREAADHALAAAQRSVALAPGLAETWFVLGTTLLALARPADSVVALEEALFLAPDHAEALANLANACIDLDGVEEAERHLRRAIALNPRLPAAHASLGFLLTGRGLLEAAVAACDAAIAVQPDFAQAHWNRGIAHLLAGDFAQGWEGYEWRKRHKRLGAGMAVLPGPEWQGEHLTGRHIVVQAEQGLGDTIQFARYLQLLAEQAGSVTLVCAPVLVRLLAQLPARVVAKGEPIGDYDVWVDLMSLPRLFGTRVDSIPSAEGYLRAEAVASLPPDARIGVVWAGNPQHANDRRRSMPTLALRPLVEMLGPALVSLQVGPAAAELQALFGIADRGAALRDFADTACVVEGLELVIAVDTSTAHLAAAMGKPVWLLLPFAPDWRWMTQRADSPWYRSIRIFRQAAPGDWDGLVREVTAALARHGLGRTA